MKLIAKGILSTCKMPHVINNDEPEPHPDPITEPTDNIHDIYTHYFENPLYDDWNSIEVDLPGQYPDTSFDRHKYIYVMDDTITNHINIKGLILRKTLKLLPGFVEYYNDLKKEEIITKLVKIRQ